MKRWAIWGAIFALSASCVRAHYTVIPHHQQDFQEIASGRDKRGIVLAATVVFVAILWTVASVVLRQSRYEKPREDLRTAQERLKTSLLHAATAIQPILGKPADELVRTAATAYARHGKHASPAVVTSETEQSFRFDRDVLNVRYEPFSDPIRIELTATCDVAGAKVSLSARGDFAVSVFATNRYENQPV